MMTYRKMHETYGFSKNLIGATYDMLQRDGFISTNGTNGTIVTFDVTNPSHLAKVPLEWPRAGPEDPAAYKIIMRLHANILYAGLTCSSKAQLLKFKQMTREILQAIQDKRPFSEQVLALSMSIIASLDNEFLNRIQDHFLSRYLYFQPMNRLTPVQRHILSKHTLEFYLYLLDALEQNDFSEYPQQFWQYYCNYYQEGGMVFAKLENGALFKEQALYGRLLDDLCIKIMAGDLKKGDALPTTVQLCEEYNISKTTVNRAYNILIEMGVICRRVRSGTRLLAEPHDPAILEALETAISLRRRDGKDAAKVLPMISSALSQCISISPEMLGEMRLELERQWSLFNRYSTPFIVSSILIGPMLAPLPAGILHQYYLYLTDIINQTTTLYMFRIHGNREHGEEIYRLIIDTLKALECGDQSLFAARAENAIRRNGELVTEDYNDSALPTLPS